MLIPSVSRNVRIQTRPELKFLIIMSHACLLLGGSGEVRVCLKCFLRSLMTVTHYRLQQQRELHWRNTSARTLTLRMLTLTLNLFSAFLRILVLRVALTPLSPELKRSRDRFLYLNMI